MSCTLSGVLLIQERLHPSGPGGPQESCKHWVQGPVGGAEEAGRKPVLGPEPWKTRGAAESRGAGGRSVGTSGLRAGRGKDGQQPVAGLRTGTGRAWASASRERVCVSLNMYVSRVPVNV